MLAFSSVTPISGALCIRCIQLVTGINTENWAIRCRLPSASVRRARQGNITVERCSITAEKYHRRRSVYTWRDCNIVPCNIETVKICGSSFRKCCRMRSRKVRCRAIRVYVVQQIKFIHPACRNGKLFGVQAGVTHFPLKYRWLRYSDSGARLIDNKDV